VPSTAQQIAVNYSASMLSSSSDDSGDGKSVARIQEEHLFGAGMQGNDL
jgi:hypothetical protein